MKNIIEVIEVNGKLYAPVHETSGAVLYVDAEKKCAFYRNPESINPTDYKIVRTYSAGVFAGYIESRDKDTVVMTKARRFWYWDGASSLSQLAMEGVKRPENCKFPCEVDRVELFGVIEILDVTNEARKNIAEVPVWAQ